MSEIYGRRWSLSVDGSTLIEQTDDRQFRVTFNILIDFGGSNNYADIRIYNLSESTANKAFKKDVILAFEAGYIDTVDTVFIGTIKNILRERQGADTITRLICRSQQYSGFINQSYGSGVDVVTLIKACSDTLGYPSVITASQFDDISEYMGGYSLQGDARVLLDKLAVTHGFSHTVENGRRIILRDGYERNTSPIIVSQFTGMEGIPQISEVGADVKMRLNPKLRIGGTIDIQSKLKTFNFSNIYFQDVPESAGTGTYKVQQISHEGDSWGDSWTSSVTAIR